MAKNRLEKMKYVCGHSGAEVFSCHSQDIQEILPENAELMRRGTECTLSQDLIRYVSFFGLLISSTVILHCKSAPNGIDWQIHCSVGELPAEET